MYIYVSVSVSVNLNECLQIKMMMIMMLMLMSSTKREILKSLFGVIIEIHGLLYDVHEKTIGEFSFFMSFSLCKWAVPEKNRKYPSKQIQAIKRKKQKKKNSDRTNYNKQQFSLFCIVAVIWLSWLVVNLI